MAQSGHAGQRVLRQLSGVKRTWRRRDAMAAYDPKATLNIRFRRNPAQAGHGTILQQFLNHRVGPTPSVSGNTGVESGRSIEFYNGRCTFWRFNWNFEIASRSWQINIPFNSHFSGKGRPIRSPRHRSILRLGCLSLNSAIARSSPAH
jgi:hypothetical protein